MDELLHGLRAAGEPTRLRLLALCAHGELTVSEITQILGQSQPRVSRHLKLLVEAGLLERFREGTWAFYRLAERGSCADLARTLIDLVPGDDSLVALDLERLESVKQARAERAADYFKRIAPEWDRIRSLHVDEGEVEAALLRLLPAGKVRDLLDVGTGTGRILRLFGPHVERAVGIDMSRDMLAFARANLEAAGTANCQVRHGDMHQLPVPSASFDAVSVHLVMHYAEAPAEAVMEAARVLRPGGRIVIVDFAPHQEEHLRDEHAHRWLGFSDETVAAWFRAAGLVPEAPLHMAGDPLTVCLWPALKPVEGAIKTRRLARHSEEESR